MPLGVGRTNLLTKFYFKEAATRGHLWKTQQLYLLKGSRRREIQMWKHGWKRKDFELEKQKLALEIQLLEQRVSYTIENVNVFMNI